MAAGHDDWSPPDEFDEYKLVRQLGRGTMGQVYLARDRMLDRLVAVKFITALEPSARERFVIEARAAARIQHPNIIAVHRVGELHHRPYLITEYVRGQSLAELALPIPWSRALELGVGLARGLAAAHRHGVLHRDIKLANAMLSETGEVKLLDFSLAKLVDAPGLERLRQHASASVTAGVIEGLVDASTSPATPKTPEAPRLSDTITLDQPQAARAGRPKTDHALGWRGGPGELTAVGALVGTPHYMAPELWRGETASRASDVYALGVLLYCLCCGHPPTNATTLLELAELVQEVDARPLADRAPEVDRRLAEIIERCIRRDPQARYSSGEELREALEALASAVRSQKVLGGNPYRGLQVFEAAHREVFFGRDAEISAVVGRLRSQSFVLVAGDSGVGKSSLCRAGVLPTACEGGLDPALTWSSLTITPGRRPVHTLVAALARARAIDEAQLERASETSELFARTLAGGAEGSGTLLFVDQLEELITLAPPAEATHAAQLLGALARGVPRLCLLATVRGDFLTRIAPLPGLGEELVRGLFFLYPLSSVGVRRAIVGPVQARGVRFESEALVSKLVTAGVDGSLPLLQFALAELWEARAPDSQTITAAALDKIGGVSGALARHAEGVLARLTPEQRRAARALLLRLVTIDETRASLTRDEVVAGSEDASVALDALVDARLRVVRDVAEGPPVYEIAHEALIRGWVSLQVWLDEERESREIRHRLEHAAAEWDRFGRRREGLWGERQLQEGRRLDERGLRPREVAFLRASVAHLRSARRRRLVLVVGAPMLVLSVIIVVLMIQRAELRREVEGHLTRAQTLLDEARAQRARADHERRSAHEAFDAGDDAAGEAAWQRVRRLSPEVQRLYTRAAGQLETIVGLDSSRVDVHAHLGDVLYEQAELAEQEYDAEQAAALLVRVEVHDPGGTRMARWRMPATVDLVTDPPGAQVVAARYERDADGRLHLGEERALGVSPVQGTPLPAGSYLLTLSAEGREVVRYPLLLARAEAFAATISLPLPTEIPTGFVYVPPGRFLYGSADPEDLRRGFFTAAPIHEAVTDAYLIARHETTYGEWIAFLDALPPEEQTRFSGRREGPASLTAPILTRDHDGVWRLETRRGDQVTAARAGELLRHAGRARNVEQDWLKLPVTGISWDDARAYLEWLDRSGRAPGARFCTEFEWERAARGADGRRFPTGDDIGPDEANFDETYRRDPLAMGVDVVGSYPHTQSPFGLLDTVGNVWEWVLPLGTRDERLARGGSYLHSRVTGQAVNRTALDPAFLEGTLGLRPCASLHVGRRADR